MLKSLDIVLILIIFYGILMKIIQLKNGIERK